MLLPTWGDGSINTPKQWPPSLEIWRPVNQAIIPVAISCSMFLSISFSICEVIKTDLLGTAPIVLQLDNIDTITVNLCSPRYGLT